MRRLSLIALSLALLQCIPFAASRAATCGRIDGVEQVLHAPGVFIGDMHGSVESPAFLRDLACHAMATHRPVVIAMEYDSADQRVLDQFLKTADEPQAVKMLTATPHWKGNRGGRASAAMRDALMSIWRQAREGSRVELLAYDGKTQVIQERDKASAEFIRSKRAGSGKAAFWIVFGGNVHARKTKGLIAQGAPPGYENYEPVGYLIRDWGLIHLNARYHGGASWACLGPTDCQVRDHGPACPSGCPAYPVIRLGRENVAYDGVYEVGKLTPSPPLVLMPAPTR